MGGTGGFQGRAGMSGQQFNGNGTGGTQQQTTPGQ